MKLVIVGRDGVLCLEREGGLASPDDWEALPGALDAVARLNHAGWQVALAATAPQLARGRLDMAAAIAIHARMHKQLAAAGGRVDSVFFCPHAPEEGCNCRAPEPGLLRQIGARYKLDLGQVHAVGASASEVQAAHQAGCVAHLIASGRTVPAHEMAHLPAGYPPTTRVHADLAAFATALIATGERAQKHGPDTAPATA